MKNSGEYGIYYIIIGFLIIMIGIPPLLRVILPKEELNDNKNNKIEIADDNEDNNNNNNNNNNNSDEFTNKNVVLACNITNPLEDDKDLISINTQYENDEVILLKFTYDDILLQESNSSQIDITKLKDIKGSSFDSSSNTVTLDFKNNQVDKTEIEQFLNKPEEQKKYYESLGLVCVNK